MEEIGGKWSVEGEGRRRGPEERIGGERNSSSEGRQRKGENRMLLIKGARLIDPASGTDGVKDILIRDERIVWIKDRIEAEVIAGEEKDARTGGRDDGQNNGRAGGRDDGQNNGRTDGQAGGDAACSREEQEMPGSVRILEAGGLVCLPGLVDTHVHFRDPGFTYKEDLESGARSAAAGGVTTVVLMANTKPCVDSVETLQDILKRGSQTCIHVESCANVTQGMKGEALTAMEELCAAGAAGFTDDGVPLLSEERTRAAMEEAARLAVPISFHEEDPSFIQNNGINAGAVSEQLGIGGSDRRAEIRLVERDMRLAEETGACVVVQHISTREAVELVREAKRRGADVHAEATPHHFTLTQDAVLRYGTLAKMNPPLRLEEDRQAIIEGLADGTIDLIATDHAPHSAEEKAKPLTEAPSGIIGLETSLSLGVTELVEKGYLSLSQLAERMSLAPARLYGLDAGTVEEGGPADLVLFDPKEEWTVEAFQSKSSNSPFLGCSLKGKIHYTVCRGRIVYEG